MLSLLKGLNTTKDEHKWKSYKTKVYVETYITCYVETHIDDPQ
jgi:hypothetical protein